MKALSANLIVAVVLLSACSSVSDVAALPLQSQRAQDFSWQGTMSPGSTMEIKGINGPVEAVPASGGMASVGAVRTGRRGADPNEVEIVVVEHANGVTVCAVPPSVGGEANECAPGDEGRLRSRNSRVQVAFTVQVPAGVNFVGKTTNGSISAAELTGEVEVYSTNGNLEVDGGSAVIAQTTNGSITVRSAGEADARTTNGRITADLRTVDPIGDPLRFVTTNGSVTVRLPANTNASLEAQTSNGRIESDLPMVVGTINRRNLSGTIGSGGREIEVRTTNGSIHIEPSS